MKITWHVKPVDDITFYCKNASILFIDSRFGKRELGRVAGYFGEMRGFPGILERELQQGSVTIKSGILHDLYNLYRNYTTRDLSSIALNTTSLIHVFCIDWTLLGN